MVQGKVTFLKMAKPRTSPVIMDTHWLVVARSSVAKEFGTQLYLSANVCKSSLHFTISLEHT